MEKESLELITKDRVVQVVLALFVLLLIWWVYILQAGNETGNLLWAASYQIIALLGGVWGVRIAQDWGSRKSIMGRSITAFAVGLLLQTFGQSVFSFYNLFLQVEIPYPSISDIGFFGSIPFYIYGILLLAKASGVTISLQSYGRKIQAIIIPLILLGLSYYFFLGAYEYDGNGLLKAFLDFGYPLGQAIYVAIAILTYILSKKVLGGIMRGRILFILLALIAQYIADSNFLYQAINLTWVNGGYGDVLYMIAYLLMALGLLQLRVSYIHTENV